MKSTDTYLTIYTNYIRPKLQEIDIYLKSLDGEVLNPLQVSRLLDIPEGEVYALTRGIGHKPARSSFFAIMEGGSSYICGLYRRELECGSPHIYTKQDIAYIYQLDLARVVAACVSRGVNEITPYTLPDILAQIEV